ncbi:NADP-dependent isocitrate dehydrogenase [Pseudomonas aeruginosa]|nr:NADP-dependent isocitrate dehydrogenase [Pseudomonas aeruginosa]
MGQDGKQKDTKAVMPESTYARIYQGNDQLLQDQRRLRPDHHGHANVGLMAQKAEEYGSRQDLQR